MITVGNEKGGTGKSTTAIHLASALSHRGFRVAGIDLDARQRTFRRFAENRRAFVHDEGISLPPIDVRPIERSDAADRDRAGEEERERLRNAFATLSGNDFVIIDTPGNDSTLSRSGHEAADTLVTPLNDSFLDIDVLARIDRGNREIVAPSVYSQMVWEQHNRRVSEGRPGIDWVVLRNRLGHVDSRSRRDVARVLELLSKRIGFRLSTGIAERVVFRELFPKGLTLLDLPTVLPEVRETHSLQTGRRELWSLLRAIGLPEPVLDPA